MECQYCKSSNTDLYSNEENQEEEQYWSTNHYNRDDLQAIAEDSTGVVQTDTIDSIRPNVVMSKVQRTTVVKSHYKNTVNNPRIIGDSSITGMNKQYQRKLIHLWKWKEVSPTYSISCVNYPVIRRRSAHVEKERRQL